MSIADVPSIRRIFIAKTKKEGDNLVNIKLNPKVYS